MRKLSDTSVKNKTVALRADLNVPVKESIILDDARIEAVIPTVKYLLTQNCKIILISHFVDIILGNHIIFNFFVFPTMIREQREHYKKQ